jgi:hypothetical protein
MRVRISAISFVVAITSLPLLAAQQQSLGDIARQLRQQQLKSGRKATKVYTNDNLPARPPDEARTAASGMAAAPAKSSSDTAQAEADSSHAAGETSKATEMGQAAHEAEKPESEKETKEYWQDKFKAARARLADAEERQHLAEDELNLLQIQQARELNTDAKAELDEKVKVKAGEVAQARETTEAAQKALEDLQEQFKASGAPEEWSETETSTD